MWQETDNKLYRLFKFKDFSSAFAFMTRVAFLAETANHHPRWTNEYNKVEIWLSTHDANNTVTEKDRELARQINGLIADVSDS
jgi:4a-hydroxytetrahydrobiopterin dehydratase